MFLLWSECDNGFGFWRFFVLLWYGHLQKIFKFILRVMLWLAQKPFNVCTVVNLYVGYALSPLRMINFTKCLFYIWRFLKLKKLTVWRVDFFFFFFNLNELIVDFNVVVIIHYLMCNMHFLAKMLLCWGVAILHY